MLMGTLSVVIILAGALILINAIAYMRMQASVESVLQYISQNNGSVPTHTALSDDSWLGDPNGAKDTPEFSYQTRYFSLVVNSLGYATDINLNHIAAFTEEEAVKCARMTVETGQPMGFFKQNRTSYAYMITKQSDGDDLIVILDCTHDFAAVQAFMRYSAWFGFICLVLYVFVLAALCNVAIRPFVRNMENQKRFITNAGHELKTPIAIISANTEVMEMLHGKNQWTESILKQSRRLTNLTNNLILLSKVGEGGHSDIVLAKLDVSKTVTAVADSFRTVIEEQGKTLTNRISEGVHAIAEEKCLYEVVNILVDNAAKYCDDGGCIEVSLTAGKKNKGALISVSNDYAEGVHVDYSRFFERFYRGDTSHNSQKAGYGIGLSMAADLVQVMKGTIHVSFKNGRISFVVKLNQ